MVPGAGIEPARCFHRGILSPLRLPISPPGQFKKGAMSILLICFTAFFLYAIAISLDPSLRDCFEMEAGVGIEPALTELQSAA